MVTGEEGEGEGERLHGRAAGLRMVIWTSKDAMPDLSNHALAFRTACVRECLPWAGSGLSGREWMWRSRRVQSSGDERVSWSHLRQTELIVSGASGEARVHQ